MIKGRPYYYAVGSARINGKPRIVSQTYLGSLDNITTACQRKKEAGIKTPDHAEVLEFGAVSALFDISERIGIRQIIDDHVGKRQQGIPVGDYIVLAAINRAVGAVSKNAFYEDWFVRTVLPSSFRLANQKNLSSQGFWNNISLIDSEKINNIEDIISSRIVKLYNIKIDCLLFDNTNFITYIDTNTNSLLAKRGKSKEHRLDLKIIGLSLMVSPDFNIPLFHEIYPGNTNDAKRFSEIIDKLKNRCKILHNIDDITIVFERENNFAANIEKLIENNPFSFHYVGGLKQNQCQELISIPISEFKYL
jgi:transposase